MFERRNFNEKTCYILLVLTAVLTLCGCGIHKIDDPATAEKFTKAVEELGFTTEKRQLMAEMS